jgi:Uma2 family endonuclease
MEETTEGVAGSGIRWTTRDLEVLPENEWIRYETIDGELFVTRAPHRKHQQVCGKIFRQLDAWSESSGLGEAVVAPGIIFSDADNVIADVVWISRERLALVEDEAGHFTAAPELVVEVLSPGAENLRRDREAKLKLYSLKGVREYWIVDRFSRQVEVYRRENARLVLVATLLGEDEIASPLLPEFGFVVSGFFV